MVALTQNHTIKTDSETMAAAYPHTDIKGRFNQYTSGFWALALPAIAARYLFRYAVDMSEGKVAKEKLPNRMYATLVGLGMYAITGYYAARTAGDIKKIFAETVAYEFDKKPQDIGIGDLLSSQNDIVQRTVQNFKKYNLRRALTLSTFFAFLLPGRFKTTKADSVDLGVGAVGGYLASDALTRKITFFEALQDFIDRKVNHVDNVGQMIGDGDLMNLYAIHSRDLHPDRIVTSRMDTVGWNDDRIIFGRMADLMNQTYRNAVNNDGADFTVPKLLYLLGHGLIRREQKEQSLTYIEIANQYGIAAVKNVARAVESGQSFSDASRAYPVILPPEISRAQIEQAAFVDKHVSRVVEQKVREEAARHRAV